VKFALAFLVSISVASLAAAQEHPPAQPSKPAAAAPAPAAKETPKETVGVLPTASPTQVAAAIAEAIRSAEAAQAKRQAASRPAVPRRSAAAPAATPQRRYELRWPSEHMVVRWPVAKSDRVQLAWPQPPSAVDDGSGEFIEP
jgi:hypothetical protein